MFQLWQAYRNEWIRPAVLYVDTLDTWTTFSSIKLLATEANETLSCTSGALEFVTDTATYPFPLVGSDFLTARTGTLRIFLATASCATGMSVFSLLNTGPPLVPLTACRLAGSGVRVIASTWTRSLSSQIQAQNFSIPSPLRVQTTASVIVSGGP